MAEKKDKSRVALASSDGIVVNSHFGWAEYFYIYEIAADGQYQFLERRQLPAVCQGGSHDDKRLSDNLRQLQDCRYIVVSRIGPGAARAVLQLGMTALELPGLIETILQKLVEFRRK